jgi:serine/threonine protein kinase
MTNPVDGRTWTVPGYAEVRSLGGGAFGDVMLATHAASGTQVAIKYLHPDLLRDPEQTALFRAEAHTLIGLDSPHVIRLYEYVEGPSGAAIVMEFVNGVTLATLLERQGKTTPEAALAVLYGSLLGLAAAHAKGVVHRDYKPANVLVNGNGASKLADFGIAALAGGRPTPAGTLRYMPPEQFEGSPASPAADVYAATVTFYQCLTGQTPFDGRTATELYEQHKSAPVRLEPVPEPLRPIVARGMAKDPRYRPSDAPDSPPSCATPPQKATATTGRTAAARSWPRRPSCCWGCCGRRAARPRSRAPPWSRSSSTTRPAPPGSPGRPIQASQPGPDRQRAATARAARPKRSVCTTSST